MRKKRMFISLLMAWGMLLMAGCGSLATTSTDTDSTATKRSEEQNTAQAGTQTASAQKTLIVYYSYSGTTQRVAEHLQELTNGTNQGSTKKDFTKRIQNGAVAEGLPIRSANGISDERLDRMLENWLSEIQG